MSKHTPGPLFVSQNKGGSCMVVTEKMAAVAEIWSPIERAKADADLFSAAPDLLQACKLALTSCEPHTHFYKMIVEAIDKAEGRKK